jgi:hypothetical protein
MKVPARKTLVLITGFAVVLTIGCGPHEPPSVKKSRAIAAENIELRKELDRCNKKLEILKEDYGKEVKEQKERLQKCLQEKEALKEKSRQNIRNQVKGVLDTVLEENTKLREENAKLKTQIKALQKQQ